MSDGSLNDDLGDGQGKPPASAGQWLALIANSEKAFAAWNEKCDNIDKRYADIERLAAVMRDREFQLFWANVQVLGPSIYARPPVPVVTPRFKDRRPLVRTSSELLERAAIVLIENRDIDGVMIAIRDDLTVNSRGQAWVRYEDEKRGNRIERRIFIDHVCRQDFAHDPARSWAEVDWVARRSWLTKDEAHDRFYGCSGDEYQKAAYNKRVGKDSDTDSSYLKAPFWELWSKSANKVLWLAEGCEVALDESPPLLELEGFFPCPRPAYSTTMCNSLVPVPDYLYYKDQIEEINEITARIGALTEALRLKGFYAAGASTVSDAIESALKAQDNNAVLYPVSDWSIMGGAALKDAIVWLPIEQVAIVIKQLIELRKQLIDDVYQITGLSDIMRGSTVASETLGAQKLKSQYGSVRIRDRQGEMVRIARDIIRIVCEVIAENFDAEQLLEMSQMQLPRDRDIQAKAKALTQQKQQVQAQIAQAQLDPALMQRVQQSPEEYQQVVAEVQQHLKSLDAQIEELAETVTIDQVVKFLRDNRTRVFSLDIETDSTIQPDEDAQKQRATEWLATMSSLFQQAVPAVQQMPQLAPVLGDALNFMNAQFRAGRQMEATIEEFTDSMKEMAAQPRPDADADKGKADAAMAAQAQASEQEKNKILMADIQARSHDVQARIAADTKVKVLGYLKDIEVARISAHSTLAKSALEAEMEALANEQSQQHEAGLAAMEQDHQMAMAGQDQQHQATMAEQQAVQQTAEPA